MIGSRWVLITILFFVDVRLRAEVRGEQATQARRTITLSAQSALTMGPGAKLERRAENQIQLVSGEFYLEVDAQYEFSTPYARFQCLSNCRALVERTLRQVTVRALTGSWKLVRLGEFDQSYQVQAGTQMSVSEVTDRGLAQMEFPLSLPWSPTVKSWAKLYPHGKEEFKKALREFRDVWRSGTEAVSDIHQQAARRTIASHEADLAARAARAKAQQEEDARLRQLFREKNYIDP